MSLSGIVALLVIILIVSMFLPRSVNIFPLLRIVLVFFLIALLIAALPLILKWVAKEAYAAFVDWLKSLVPTTPAEWAAKLAGKIGTLFQGLFERGEAMNTHYMECLTKGIEKHGLQAKYQAACAGKKGLELQDCAAGVLNENDPDVWGKCYAMEAQTGPLANLWKSVCGFVPLESVKPYLGCTP